MSKFIAIDLDPQGVFAVAGSARGGQAKVDQAVAWDGSDSDGPPALTAETAKQIGEQIRDRLRAAGVGQAPVLVSVPRDRVILKELRYPAVPPAEEPNVVRFQAVKELTDSPDEVVLDYVPLAGAPDGERRSMAVAVRKDLYAAVRAMCAAANLRLEAVTPRPYAVAAGLARAFAGGAVEGPESGADAVAALTVGPGGGEFTVSRGGEVTFTRTVPGPVVASAPMLLAEVRRNLTVYAGANPGHPVGALYVAETDGRWAARLGAALGIPVRPYDPLAGAAPAVPDHARGRFAGAAGLLAARAAGDPPINFASPRQPKAEIDPKRNQLMLAVLAALVLLGVGGAYGFFTLKAADDDLALLTRKRDDLKKEWEVLEPDAKRLAAADGWKARRVVWLDELFDMAARFPKDGAHAISFHGQAQPPDPKTGKQETQGRIELRVTSRSPEPVIALLGEINRDATDPAPKDPARPAKFYVGADKGGGAAFSGDPEVKDFNVTTRVNSRPADKFSRAPAFSPPSRKAYPPPVAAKKEPEKEPEKEKEEAPAPKAKEAGDG